MESLRKTTLLLLWMALLAGVISLMGWRLWEEKIGHLTVAQRLGAVFVPALVAGGLYWLVALAFKIPEAAEILEFAFARFKRKS